MPIVVSLVVLAATVLALIDIIRRDEGEVRYLPKLAWVLLVVLIPLIGVLLWLLLGREYAPRPATHPRGYREPAAAPQPVPPYETRSTEQQLADLEREIEEDRLRAERERRRRERESGAAGGAVE